MNPRGNENEKIDLLNLLRVKEITSMTENLKPTDVTKATKPSFLEDNNSFLPPIQSREMSIISGGVGILTSMNRSVGVDSTNQNSIEETRIFKDSYRTSKRNSQMDR